MFIDTQELHTLSWGAFFGELCHLRVRSFIDLPDDDDLAPRLQDSEYFAHSGRQVGPPEVRFHGGYKIEHGVRERELRHRAMPDLDPAHIYPVCVCSLACC